MPVKTVKFMCISYSQIPIKAAHIHIFFSFAKQLNATEIMTENEPIKTMSKIAVT